MISLLLIVAPGLAALAMFPLQRQPRVATWLAAGVLAGMAALAAAFPTNAPIDLLGRSLELSAQASLNLALIGGTLALAVFYSGQSDAQPMSYGLVLGAVALFAASILVDSITITALTLQLGAIMAAMLIPAAQPHAAMAGMRTMVLFVFAGSLLVLASWATGGQGGPVDSVTLTYIIGVSVTVGIGILLAVFPFHIWLAPAQRGSPLVAVMLSVALSVVALAQLNAILGTNLWPGGRSFFGLLMLLGGLGNAVWGAIGAFVQRSLRRVLAYAAMADLGLILIGIGLDTSASVAAANLQLLYRGLGVTLVAVSVHVLTLKTGSDEIAELRGAWKRAPLAVIGLAAGGISLVGLPPMAGFANRFVLYQLLAAQHPAWVVPVTLAAAGPAWAFMRALATALMPPEEGAPPQRSTPLIEWLIIVPLVLALILPGIFPHVLTLLPAPWAELITGSAAQLLGG